jgi:hypothetical protein
MVFERRFSLLPRSAIRATADQIDESLFRQLFSWPFEFAPRAPTLARGRGWSPAMADAFATAIEPNDRNPRPSSFRQLFGLRAACPKSAIFPRANWKDANARLLKSRFSRLPCS